MLATLDALQSLLGDARSGDLARGGDTVDVSTVLAWLKAGLNIDADELESVRRFWCAVTGSDGAPADASAMTAKARLRQVRGEGHPTQLALGAPPSPPLRQAPRAAPADPERLEAELATFQTARMPLEAALAAPPSVSAMDERTAPALAASAAAPPALPAEAAPEASGRRPFWSLFARRRQDKAQRSDAAAASRLASLLRG
jgi:hypothetical protein